MGPVEFIVPDDAITAERMEAAFTFGRGWLDLSRAWSARRSTSAVALRPGDRRDDELPLNGVTSASS
jgi:hypothetical protein